MDGQASGRAGRATMSRRSCPRVRWKHLWGVTVLLVALSACRTPAAPSATAAPPATAAPSAASTAASPPAVASTAGTATAAPAPSPTAGRRADGLTEAEAETLASLQKVDDYPLYTMRYVASYEQGWTALDLGQQHTVANGTLSVSTAWACSLFAALGDPQSMLYGLSLIHI